jgi:hypothetical protein
VAGSEQVVVPTAPPARRRVPRWLRRTLAVVVTIALVWALVTLGWAVADKVALDARADQLQTAWSADPERLAAARSGGAFGAPTIGRWQWSDHAQAATARRTSDGLVVTVVGGSCQPRPWTVTPRWTDDLLVIDARPDVPVLPDATIFSRLGPQGCDSAGHAVDVLVPLDRPLDGRLVVDAWSGVALLPRQSP